MPKRWAKSKENKSSDSNYNTQNISDLILKANVVSSQGKYDEALTLYDKAIQLDPKNVTFVANKATILSDQGKYDEALASYDKALEIDPKNAYTNIFM